MITFYNVDDDCKNLINKIYKTALNYFKQEDIFDVEVEFISASKIKNINNIARNVDSVTDVLSFPSLEIENLPITREQFPFDINCETNCIILGELIMCMERIKEQAEEFGHSLTREAGYLFLHGLLHLFGYDHIEDNDKIKMRKAEEEILGLLNIGRTNEQ